MLNVERLEDRCTPDIAPVVNPTVLMMPPVGGVIPPPAQYVVAPFIGTQVPLVSNTIVGTQPVQPSPIPQLNLMIPDYPMPPAGP